MARIMGARSIMVGLQAGIVAALIDLDVNVEGVEATLDLESAFERILNRPTHRWDPTEGIEIHEGTVDAEMVRENASQLAVAIGLASRVQEM